MWGLSNVEDICPMWGLSNVDICPKKTFVWCYICPTNICLTWHLSATFVQRDLSNWCVFNGTFVWYDACLTYICLTYICLTYVCPIWLLCSVLFVQCDVCSMWLLSNVTFVQCDFCPMLHLYNVTFVQTTFVQCVQNNYYGTDVCLTYVCPMWLVTNVIYTSNTSNTSGDKRGKQDKQCVLLNWNTDIVITHLMPPNSSRLTSPKLFI
jgi:hypothetical protein